MFWSDCYCILKKELLIYSRSKTDCLIGIVFFFSIAALFPLTLNGAEQRLVNLGPGIIWVSAFLAMMISLSQLFREDFNDGTLAQYVLGPSSLSIIVLLKCAAHWLVFSLPLIIVAPILAVMFHLPWHAIAFLLLTLLLGTPILHLLGAFVAGLTVGLRQSNLLVALLLVPLFVPTLIFSCSVVLSAIQLTTAVVPLLLLCALLVFSVTVMPLLTAVALRISVNYS